ncbi:MAG: GDP-mannose 4,6-dehydratase, partial [archaeon]|nr:GDP-mannose 4,6-dehydratase [archaeon]
MSFAGKSVMVTGGAGFIGSTLVRELLKENANITVVDNFSSGRMDFLGEVKDSIKIEQMSITSPNFQKTLEKNDIEFVFNLAAMPYIPDSYHKPREFFEVNSMGAMHVLLSCKAAGVKRVMQYSTSEVYGGAQRVPMDEHHPINPMSTYAV